MPLVMFACNHYRNGEFAGRFQRCDVQIGSIFDCMLELESPWVDRSLKIGFGNGSTLRVGKDTWFEIEEVIHWLGNWCYEGVRMSPAETARLLNFLRKRGYRCHCGPSAWYERFNRERGPDLEFTEADVREGVKSNE